MSNSTFQSLLMESGVGLPTPEPACEYDPYYNTGPTNDPYWASVTALLHFDGNLTDSSSVGATYTDNSTSFNTTTARFDQSLRTTHNTTQGLQSPLSSDYDLNSGDFTLEGWVRIESTVAADRLLFGVYDSSGVAEYNIVVTSSPSLRVYIPTGAATQTSINGFSVALNYWTHVAVTRTGDLYKFFCDGREILTIVTNSYRRSTGNKYLRIGNAAPGSGATAAGASYDDIRLTVGVSRYSTSFAYSLTAYPNALETTWSPSDPRTVLSLSAEPLRLKNNVLSAPCTTDANDTVTYEGEQITAVLNDPAAVTFGVDGMTIVADSTANYVTYTGNKVIPTRYYDIIEYRVTATYTGTLSGSGGGIPFIRVGTGAKYAGIGYYVQSGIMRLFIYYRLPTNFDFSYTDIPIPETAEFAIRFNKRNQTLTWLMNDGIISQRGTPNTTATPSSWADAGFRIGPDAQASRGGVTSVTIKDCTIKEYYQEDSAGYQPQKFYIVRNASTVSDVVKFGEGAYRSWNTGTVSATRKFGLLVTEELTFGTGDFTLDMWAYRLAHTYLGYLWVYSSGTSGFASVDTSGDLNVSWLSSGGTQNRNGLAAIPLNQWVHFAIQRRGTLLEVYVDGVQVDSVAISGGASSTINPGIFTIGSSSFLLSDTSHYNGYVDAVRVLKGAARYTGNFTPPGLPTCDASDPGVVIPTSGTEYPQGESATVQTGQITLANHYQPLSGQSTTVNQGYVRIGAAPITPTLTYTTSSNPSTAAVTPLNVQLIGRLIFSSIGGVTFLASYSYSNGEGSFTGATLSNWLDPSNAFNGQYYEVQIDPSYRINYPPPSTPPGIGIDYSATGIAHFTVNGDGGNNIWNSMEVERMLPLYRNFEKSNSSQLDFVDLSFSVRPRAGSGLTGLVYEKTYTIRINFAASKFK